MKKEAHRPHKDKTGLIEVLWFVGIWLGSVTVLFIISRIIKLFL